MMAALAEMKGINTSGVREREDNGPVLRFMAVNYYASTLTQRSVASYPIARPPPPRIGKSANTL